MSHDQFQNFYKNIYGDRWAALSQSLVADEKQMARWNLWAGDEAVRRQQIHQQKLDHDEWLDLGGPLLTEKKVIPQRTAMDVLDFYIMDPASVMAARALQVRDGDRVLDMCAAPGGKSLVLIEALQSSGEIFCNDLSMDRRERLKKVIQNYVPREIRSRIWVKGLDAVQYGLREAESFDRILLDAPCSGERHVLADLKALSEWSVQRPQRLAQRQYSLLSAAFLALKPLGQLVYSTCSLNPEENDEVIRKLLKKRGDFIEVAEIEENILPGSEKTEFGLIYLPDRCGFGPLYVSRLFKRNSFKSK